jgi:hypothetical protein
MFATLCRPAVEKNDLKGMAKKPTGGVAAGKGGNINDSSEFIIREVRTAKVLTAEVDDDDFVPDL